MRVFGLKSCDSCRKAMKWLADAGQEFDFVDVRDSGMTRSDVAAIVDQAGAGVALNRKSTTWRQMSEAERAVSGDQQVVDLIVRHPALLKRPVIDLDGLFIVGFGAAQQAELAQVLS